MITLRTIAYVVGITIAISAFGLFLYSFLPHLIENDQWERLGGADVSEEELLKKFQEHEAYIVFYDRFSDAKEDFRYYKYGGGEMQVGTVNFEKNNSLILSLNYNDREEAIYADVRCNVNEDGYRDLRADNLFVIDFIKQTNCLEIESTITNTSLSLEEEPKPPINFSGSSSCGPDARYSDGVCVVTAPFAD